MKSTPKFGEILPIHDVLTAADRKWSSRAVFGVTDDGNRLSDPRAVLIRPTNTSDTRGTVVDKNFRFAAATVKMVEWIRTSLRLVQSVEKTRRQLFHHVAHTGRVMLIPIVFDR